MRIGWIVRRPKIDYWLMMIDYLGVSIFGFRIKYGVTD